MKALRRMSGKPFCKSLEESVRNYRTKKEKELKLLELIEDGMALITPESPVLTGYQYDWAYEEECDFPRWEWKARSCWSILLVIRWRSVSRGI